MVWHVWYSPREGVIIECPLNGQIHDARDVILTSRTDVRGMNNDDDVQTLDDVFKRYKLLEWRFVTILWFKMLVNIILTTYNVLIQINVTKRHFNDL